MSKRSRMQNKNAQNVSYLVNKNGVSPNYKPAYPNWVSPVYWATDAWNQAAFRFFFEQFETLAMNRFKWLDLPPEVNPWFLEQTLFYCGMATITAPVNLPMQNAFAMQVITNGNPNANYEFEKWEAIGYNGKRWSVTPENGVIVYDNWLRTPIVDKLEFIAAECANIMRTKQTIRQHMRQPVIIEAPQEMKQQLTNLESQIANGNPYVTTYNGFSSDFKVETLPIATSNESQEITSLQADLKDMWNLGLSFLGITVGEKKAERQSVPEIQQESNPTNLQALNSLTMRRRACEQLNKLTGGNTSVVWNTDIESDNFNVMNNFATLLSAPNGDDILGTDSTNSLVDSEGNAL